MAESLLLSTAWNGARLCLREAEIPLLINVEYLSSWKVYILDGKKVSEFISRDGLDLFFLLYERKPRVLWVVEMFLGCGGSSLAAD